MRMSNINEQIIQVQIQCIAPSIVVGNNAGTLLYVYC